MRRASRINKRFKERVYKPTPTYYVSSSNGNDSNDGLTKATPWETLNKVYNERGTFVGGDIIAFKGGDKWNGNYLYLLEISGDTGNPITFTAYGSGEKPIIDIQDVEPMVWTADTGNVWVSDYPYDPRRMQKNGSEIMVARQYENLGEFIPTQELWWRGDKGDGLKLYGYSTTDPNLDEYSVPQDNRAIWLQECSYITIDGLDLRGGTYQAISCIGSQNIIIENCDVGKLSFNGIKIASENDGSDPANTVRSQNIIIRNNNIGSGAVMDYSQGGTSANEFKGVNDGIQVTDGYDIFIYDNIITDWGHASIDIITANVNAAITPEATDIKIYDNKLSASNVSYGGGLTFDRNAHHNEAYNNEIYHAKGSQLNGWSNHIHHNVFRDILHSKVYGSLIGFGIQVQDYVTNGGYPPVVNNLYENNIMIRCEDGGIDISPSNYAAVSGHTFRNNIIYECGSENDNFGIWIRWAFDDSNDNQTFENNIIYNSLESKTILYHVQQVSAPSSGITVSEFNAKSDRGHTISDNVGNNPLFVNPENDWQIQSGSTAINRGVTSSGLTLDYYGNQIPYLGTAPDIGIHENRINDYFLINFDAINADTSTSGLTNLIGDPWTVVRDSKGTYISDTPYFGSQLVINGTFDTNLDNWVSSEATWTVNGATFNYSGGYAEILRQNSVPVVGLKTYRLSFDMVRTTGYLQPFLGGVTDLTYNSTGYHEMDFIMPETPSSVLSFNSTGFVGSITNISIKEVEYINVKTAFNLGAELANFGDGNISLSSLSGSVISNVNGNDYTASAASESNDSRPRLTIYNLTVGKTYKVSYEVTSFSGTGDFDFFVDGTRVLELTNWDIGTSVNFEFVEAAGLLHFDFDGSMVWDVDFTLSIKEVIYEHAARIQNDKVLIESASTNLFPYSEDISDTDWQKFQVSLDTGNAAPDGNDTATGIISSVDNGDHFVGDSVTVVSGETNTFSAFLKKGDRDWGRLWNTTVGYADFDLNNGVVGTQFGGVVGAIEAMQNEWYRCSITYTATNTGGNTHRFYPLVGDDDRTFSGDGVTINTYIWGMQAELGGLSSYIFTSGATETREADEITIIAPSGSTRMIEWVDDVEQPIELISSGDTITMKDGTTKILIGDESIAAIYASNRATVGGTGTIENPYDIQSGFDNLVNGQTLYLRGGTYKLTGNAPSLYMGSIGSDNPTTATSFRTVKNYPGETPALDASALYWENNEGNGRNSWVEGVINMASTNQWYSVVDGIHIINVLSPDPTRNFSFNKVAINNGGGAESLTVKNCYTYNTTSSGIYLSGNNHLIDNNEVEKFTTGGNQEGITCIATTNTTISNNYVHDMDNYNAHANGIAIDIKDGGTGNKVFGNRIHNARLVGIYLDVRGIIEDIEVYNNYIYNVGGIDGYAATANGIVLSNELPAGTDVINNAKIYNNIIFDQRAKGISVGWSLIPGNPITNAQIVNNVCYNNAIGIACDATSGAGISAENIMIANNILSENDEQITYYSSGNVAETEYIIDTNTIVGTQSASGFTNWINNNTLDPLFTDAANGDFTLQLSSPSINSGKTDVTIYEPTYDYDGNPRVVNGIDIGAYETDNASLIIINNYDGSTNYDWNTYYE